MVDCQQTVGRRVVDLGQVLRRVLDAHAQQRGRRLGRQRPEEDGVDDAGQRHVGADAEARQS